MLFRETQSGYWENGFKLVVPVLHCLGKWLGEMAELIEKSQQLQNESAALRLQSVTLCAEAAEARATSRAQRRRSARECARNILDVKPLAAPEQPGNKQR